MFQPSPIASSITATTRNLTRVLPVCPSIVLALRRTASTLIKKINVNGLT